MGQLGHPLKDVSSTFQVPHDWQVGIHDYWEHVSEHIPLGLKSAWGRLMQVCRDTALDGHAWNCLPAVRSKAGKLRKWLTFAVESAESEEPPSKRARMLGC